MTLAKMERPATDAVLAYIERRLDALGDQGDVLNTYNAQAKWAADQSRFTGWRQEIHTSTATLAKVEPEIAALEKFEKDLPSIRKTICDELLTITSPIRDPQVMARAENLRLSIRIIDFGKRCDGEWTRELETLPLGDHMRAAGYVQAAPEASTNQAFGPLPWYGSLAVVEGRLKELRARRDEAQMRLDTALREAVAV